ncbi:PAS domain S-box protein [Paraflavitalea sp. CAU 1676]|uniref:PAS domain S-box protein n=1 Tax=Paraflavitalea sp. CAU 1676 TaxID=3032598 RepID=UPI0023DC83E8|nr:PAS domain S-box protein [Paraflavitalea sp. CAU 1676]MDF2186818.1 PAS domain S-box protein [Paraflavitalea sp. CAU 1676]
MTSSNVLTKPAISMKTYRPILFVSAIVLAGVTFFLWSAWKDRRRAEISQQLLFHNNRIINALDTVQILLTSKESAVRGYTISGDYVFIAHLPHYNKIIKSSLATAGQLLSNNPEQIGHLEEVTKLVNEKDSFQQLIIQARKSSIDSAIKLSAGLKGKNFMDQISAHFAEMKTAQNVLLQQTIALNKESSRKSLQTSIIGALAVLAFIGILLSRLNRDFLLRRRAEDEVAKSESKYREFVENAGVITYTADIDGYFTFISKQVETLTGYTPDEMIGKHFSVLIPPEHIPDVAEKYYNQFRNRIRETTLTFPIQFKGNGIRWVEQDAILLEKDGRVQGFQCVVKDVTEQELVRQKLEKIEAEQKEYQYRIQAILDNAPLMIYVKDLEGRYLLANRQCREVFGLSDDDILGKTVFEVQGNKQSADRYNIADQEVIKTRKPVELEDVLRLADGDHHLLTIKFPLYDKDNNLLGVSGFMKDITEMVKSRQEMILARQKAESAETLQEQFLANMSHEIRTPMNGILGMTNLLMQTQLEKQQREYVQMIKQSSDNLLVLINDILDLSKIKAGKISIEKIPFDLSELLKTVNATFRMKAAEKQLSFSTLLHPSVPTYIVGDPHRLSQILNNLLSNAIKFTEKGFVTLEINLQEIKDQQATLCIQVSDSGIGIDTKQLGLIFESFSQASSDTTRRFGGTGLGLAITKRLAEMQKGSIQVSSKAGAGTTFTVVLPFGISSAQEVARTSVQIAPPVNELDGYAGHHVLIVEDNDVNQRVLKYNLEQYQIEVSVVENGKDAVRWLEKNKTDLVLMDLHMPLMDGFQATDYIRRQLKLDVPIVVLTASVLRNEKSRCLQIGANDYVAKPFAPEELRRCLDRYLLQRGHENGDGRTEGSSDNITPVFDISLLMQLNNDKAIREIYTVFESMVPAGLEEMKELAIQENWKAVYDLAHKLKSSLGIIQVKDLLGKMATIETNARSQQHLKEILPMINESIAAYYHVAPMIKMEIEKTLA